MIEYRVLSGAPRLRSRLRAARRHVARTTAMIVAVAGFGLVPFAGPANAATDYTVTRSGSTYQAASTGQSYTGSLKHVMESAVSDMNSSGGGTLTFTAGTFDFGSEFFKVPNITNITFAGAGMGSTVIQNSSNALADTEPFNFSGAFNVTVRDLTVKAGGSARNTSDALDFDNGNDSTVIRVEVAESRGRGIIFDGKNAGWNSANNTIQDCVINGTNSDGIELLASTHNVIQGCSITNVGGHGIQLARSSSTAPQPNKKSSDNVIRNNTIDQSGNDGVNMNGGDKNQLLNNTITNSANVTSNHDGIEITSAGVSCNDNIVRGNISTDNQSTKTQRYGLSINNSSCNRTVVGSDNNFSGNLTAPINDLGTNTIYEGSPPPPPPPPPPSGAGPVADSYVNASNPDNNYGSADQLRVDRSPDVRSYLRFEVTGLSGPVSSAKLRVFARSNRTQGYDVNAVSNNTWGEKTITYNNKPAVGQRLGTSGPAVAGSWNEIDVTNYVNGNGTYSFALMPLSATALRLGSKEFSSPPVLVVTADHTGNRAPVANDLSEATNQNVPLSWTPDVSDPDNDPLTCTISSQPSHGTASVAGDCSDGTYTPDSGYAGPDSFGYRADDGSLTDVGTVSITVNSTPGTGTTVRLQPVADTYVHASEPARNFGARSSMRVDGSPEIRSYLRFDLGQVTGSIQSVKLRVHALSNHRNGYDVHRVADNGWVESQITFLNAPAPGAQLASSGRIDSGATHEIDLTAHITSADEHSFALVPINNTNLTLSTREGVDPPELVVETTSS